MTADFTASRPFEERATILIVDDQAPNLQIVGDALLSAGYDIVVAGSGEQALKRLEARRPDLILLDVIMPGLNGVETCARIQEHPQGRNVPVIFLSAADDKNLIVRALESGGVDFVSKPFNRAELLSRVRTHIELKRARDALRALAEDKDELLGILTHDLKNHLGGTQMSAQLLAECEDRLPDARCRRLVANILESTTVMLASVKEILANSDFEHRQAPAALHRLCLAEAAAHTLRAYQSAAERKQLRVESEFPPDGALVLGDSSMLRQVLDNLVSNAMKFSPPGSTVRVWVTAAQSGGYEVHVQDSGPGFSEEDRRRMFRRYGRLSARPTGGEPSTGLGLSIVLRLVQLMNGRISLLSPPGAGAHFAVFLPAAPAVSDPVSAPRTRVRLTTPHNPRWIF